MFNDLTALGYGLVIFAIIVGVGSVVVYNFAGTQACLNSLYAWNSTANKCYLITNNSAGNDVASGGSAYTNLNYMLTQLGTTGLAGWTPAIVAIAVGLLFLGAFMIKGGRKGKY